MLLSGPIAVGKSAIATELINVYNFATIKSGGFLADLAKQQDMPVNRETLQQLGDTLDTQTDYRWLIDEVATPAIKAKPSADEWLLDSVRKERQVQHFRAHFKAAVAHVHLTAPESVLRERYAKRLELLGHYLGSTPYDVVTQHPNETSARSLSSIADFTVDVAEMLPSQAAALVVGRAKR